MVIIMATLIIMAMIGLLAFLVNLISGSVKTNIADSLNVVVHIERRPGRRFISEVLQINSYDPDSDLFDFCSIYLAPRENS